jgi:hypothetical protein
MALAFDSEVGRVQRADLARLGWVLEVAFIAKADES